ncbi:hypothetical protein RYX36_033544 [Vicia faba]
MTLYSAPSSVLLFPLDKHKRQGSIVTLINGWSVLRNSSAAFQFVWQGYNKLRTSYHDFQFKGTSSCYYHYICICTLFPHYELQGHASCWSSIFNELCQLQHHIGYRYLMF